MGVGAGLYMYDVVVKSSHSLSHLLMSFCTNGHPKMCKEWGVVRATWRRWVGMETGLGGWDENDFCPHAAVYVTFCLFCQCTLLQPLSSDSLHKISFVIWFIPIEDLLCRFAEYPQNKSKFNQFSWQFWWQLNAYGYHKFKWWTTLWNSFICPLLILSLDVCQFMIFWLLIMVALNSRCGHYIFVLWFLLSSSSSSSFFFFFLA